MKPLSDKEFNFIRVFAKEKLGVNFTDEKRVLIFARLRSRVEELGFDSFTQYCELLEKDRTGKEIIIFTNKLTTNHTFFMRENEHFYYLLEQIFPMIERNHSDEKNLLLWCAGCSSGEESYTLAMLADKYFKNKTEWNTEILASDISTNVLSKAVRGVYPNKSLENMEQEMIKAYFDKYDNENVIVKKKIKDKITFRRNNLIYDNFNFKKKMQVIFCRNVMIYFDNETKTKLVKKFFDVTEPGGFLFISHSESLNHLDTGYEFALPGIYRKPFNT